MNAMNWLKWCLAGLLAASVPLLAIGCSGDDDEEATPATTTVVVTNVTGSGTTWVTNVVVVATNAPVDPPIVETNAPAFDSPVFPPLVLRLAAPKMVAPADGKTYETALPAVFTLVKFEWSAVAGAASYVVEVNGKKYATDGTSKTIGFLLGTHTWRVWARTAGDVDGWSSATRTFSCIEKN